ncbi:hypothetical protein SAMN02745220_00460 [Desulfopila aestuarii DSM 18488]|uniref:Uncharacterized protein n=1 Tax=Desulfopila aestuarii DSM 18488 TaxID=1121416 RepID=A0A1M7XXT7_9BACT|nr:hypothetical protein SAMN02745220_00460 [Desulfopila aestuarii DSM 18488]
MRISKTRTFCCLFLFLTSLVDSSVWAWETSALPPENVIADFFGKPVSGEDLSALSGGQNIDIDNINMLINRMNLNSELENNVLQSTTTGINVLTSGAFANANGISTVIQNSGNQVIINSALILNVRLD